MTSSETQRVIVFTSSRDHREIGPIAEMLSYLTYGRRRVELVHGDCPGRDEVMDGTPVWVPGGDQIADFYARAHRWRVRAMRPDWSHCENSCRHELTFRDDDSLWCPDAGKRRNQRMIDYALFRRDQHGADIVCAAAPLPSSRGTWDCVQRARRAQMEIVLPQDIQRLMLQHVSPEREDPRDATLTDAPSSPLRG